MRTYKEITTESKVKHLVSSLLSAGTTNTKTAKNKGITFILYIAPHRMNNKDINLCAGASEGCIFSCLYSAGRGKFNNVQQARINKANYYVNDKKAFVLHLATEIRNKAKYHAKKGNDLFFRLNGTADLDLVYMLKKYANLDIADFKNVQFYDYTKIQGKAIKYVNHPNYTVAFSRSENNENKCLEVLKSGGTVAIVFRNELPKTWNGYKVVDGDKSDLEMIKHKNVVLGLKAKGEGKKDISGFVVD